MYILLTASLAVFILFALQFVLVKGIALVKQYENGHGEDVLNFHKITQKSLLHYY